MFGLNYWGQPYYGQGYAGPTGPATLLLEGAADGTATAEADLIRQWLLDGSTGGDADAALNLRPIGRLQRYGYGITWEDS